MPKRFSVSPFTDDEYDVLAEFLRIAQQELLSIANKHELIWKSGLTEMLRQHAEKAADLRERIEQR